MESPLQVKLAGFNVDVDGLNQVKNILRKDTNSSYILKVEKEVALQILSNLTPETIAASYARISRDPRPIPELRADARKDVEGSRKSCKSINFTMGHKSIAEHAVFNFDIMGLSRRAVEEVESKRLQSYLEKSQRYITMEGDFVIPKEIQGTPFESRFIQLIELQNGFYKRNLGKITDWHHAQDYSKLYEALGCVDNEDRQFGTREGLGKEDARYSLGQATQAQFGMTASARNIEELIRRLRSSNIEELKELGEKIQKEVDGIAPSLIKYTEPVDYFSKTRKEMGEFVVDLIRKYNFISKADKIERVKLFKNLRRDDSILAGMIFSSSELSYRNSLFLVEQVINIQERRALLEQADKYQEKHDPKLREYELGDRVAEFIISSSGFAQLKRHRMNTLIPQKYLVELGHTTLNSIFQMGLSEELDMIIEQSNQLHNTLLEDGLPDMIAEYALTNANRRRVLFDANNRQAYAFCCERENLAAQWDIRETANEYHKKIQKESPLTTAKLCGKDKFYEFK